MATVSVSVNPGSNNLNYYEVMPNPYSILEQNRDSCAATGLEQSSLALDSTFGPIWVGMGIPSFVNFKRNDEQILNSLCYS